ncbi:MAG: hypothetical protein MJZ20_03750 [Bacteroidaceae bacterium]|nr:hypothetical protein [Bacteroidaceae bacterium]
MKKWGIIGALAFFTAVAIGYFCKFDSAVIIQLGVIAFGFAVTVTDAVSYAKKNNIKTWATVFIIVFAAIGGVLCCIGGLNQSIFAEISGAALALLAVIFGMIYAHKAN